MQLETNQLSSLNDSASVAESILNQWLRDQSIDPLDIDLTRLNTAVHVLWRLTAIRKTLLSLAPPEETEDSDRASEEFNARFFAAARLDPVELLERRKIDIKQYKRILAYRFIDPGSDEDPLLIRHRENQTDDAPARAFPDPQFLNDYLNDLSKDNDRGFDADDDYEDNDDYPDDDTDKSISESESGSESVSNVFSSSRPLPFAPLRETLNPQLETRNSQLETSNPQLATSTPQLTVPCCPTYVSHLQKTIDNTHRMLNELEESPITPPTSPQQPPTTSPKSTSINAHSETRNAQLEFPKSAIRNPQSAIDPPP